MNDSATFWASKVQPLQPAQPEYAPASGNGYRASRAHASGMYSDEWVAGANGQRNGYVPGSIADALSAQHANRKSLADYQGNAPVSKHLQRSNESDRTYLARIESQVIRHIDHLPAAEREAVEANIAAARERMDNENYTDHDSLRSFLGSREDGLGKGLFGNDESRMTIEQRAIAAADQRKAQYDQIMAKLNSGQNLHLSEAAFRLDYERSMVAVSKPTILGSSGAGIL